MRSIVMGFLVRGPRGSDLTFRPERAWCAGSFSEAEEASPFVDAVESAAMLVQARLAQRRRLTEINDEQDEAERVLDAAVQRLKALDPDAQIPDLGDYSLRFEYRVYKGETRGFFKDTDSAKLYVVEPETDPLLARLDAFVDAAINLSRAWEQDRSRLTEGYPEGLPSFDEFVNRLLIWRDEAREHRPLRAAS
jgi:hypothetical protein